MLRITIPATELWDERIEKFVQTEETTLLLEHSLVSISKWESKWCKPFLSKTEKTTEEAIDYIRCMTLNDDVDPNVYTSLTNENMAKINEYIDSPMTATTFSNIEGRKPNREIVTSEIIYNWMISLQIPSEYENWHINRLISQIRVCSIKNAPPKKMSQSEVMRQQRELNAARREQFNTKG